MHSRVPGVNTARFPYTQWQRQHLTADGNISCGADIAGLQDRALSHWGRAVLAINFIFIFFSFKQGLQTLGVLEKIQAYPAAFWSILCMKPERLTAKAMADLFTITHYADPANIRKYNAVNLWQEYLQDTEDGVTSVSLESILNFATGLDHIPPAGFHPQPSILFHYTPIIPTAWKNKNCIEVPGKNAYRAFRKSMDKAICDALCKT
ncbi:hypothetical protein AB205_0128690 [Aquarana catesbeiana]|uniref:HECT domain-containing protein n=1 Tax=Aquarana catesbeiana TaxID=8400 RepID=A0A2G9S0K4_AQUCT|nr:hypothetical protein AB205_0128690 [Aquarana catesbeiana]